MSTLTAAQIAGYAQQAGWSGADLATAVAVAMAESSGRTDARGDVALQTGTWGPSIGLWQIRSLKAQKGTGGTRDEVANADPATNAKHAREIFGGSGWRAWSTFNTGAYLLYLPAAKAAAKTPTAATGVALAAVNTAPVGLARADWWVPLPGGNVINIPIPFGAEAVTGPIQAAANAAELLKQMVTLAVKTAAWVANPNNWARTLKIGVGIVLVGAGVVLVLRPVAESVAAPVIGAGAKIAKVAL